MPTNRKRVSRSIKPSISESLKHYFSTGQYGTHACPDCPGQGETFLLANPGKRDELRKVWLQHRDEIMGEWISTNPCSRPWIWWKFESMEPRQRMGGIGTPDYEVLAYAQRFEKGIPAGWISKSEEDYFSGRSLDIHGKPIGTDYKEGDFKGVAIDPDDPPRYESEAVFLQRNGLLTLAEETYLTKHPELMEPEKVEFEDDKDD